MPILDERTIKEVLDDNEFELPVGYVDGDGVLHKTAKLQEMTGEVDEAIADQKVRTNAGKMVTEALNGVVTNLGTMRKHNKDTIRNLCNPDRDFLLLMNYKVSIGEDVEWTDVCPKCEGKHEVIVNIDSIPVKYMTQDEPKELVLELPNGIKDAEGKVYKKMKVSIPTGMVQERIFPIIQGNPNQAVTQMLAMVTEDIEGLSHWNFETFRKMTKKDRKYISEQLSKVEVGADLAPKVSCANCGHEYKAQIPVMTLLGE